MFKGSQCTLKVSIANFGTSFRDLESEVMRGPGSIPTRGNIFHWIFLFSHTKASDAKMDILPTLFNYEKP